MAARYQSCLSLVFIRHKERRRFRKHTLRTGESLVAIVLRTLGGASRFFRRTEQHRQTPMPVHRNPPPFFHRHIALLPCALMAAAPLHAQEQVDLGDKVARGSGAVNKLTFRIRVVTTVPEQSIVRVSWRHGGRLCISRSGARGKGECRFECRFHRAAQRPQRTRTRTARRVGEIVPRSRADAETLRRDRAPRRLR